MADQTDGLLVPGNIDLNNRPRVKNADGSISTVRSIGVNVDGKEVLIPTVVGNRVVSDADAVKEYKKTGQHLGIFDTPAHSDAYAQKLHENQAALITKPMADQPPALSTEDYQALHGMLLSEDAPTRAQGLALSKKLTPTEQQSFFDYQQSANKGKGELTRVDDQSPAILGAVSAGTAIGRAAAAPGLSLVARGVAGAKAAVGQAAPLVKYEAARTGLHAVGVPEPFAAIGAGIVSGYRRGAAPAAAAAEAPAVAAAEPAVAAAARPSVSAVLSDVELARQEFAAGRLPKSVLDAMERRAAQVRAPTPTGPAPLPSGTLDRLAAQGVAPAARDAMTAEQAATALKPAPVADAGITQVPGARPVADYAPADMANEAQRVAAMQGVQRQTSAPVAPAPVAAPIAQPAAAGPAVAAVPRGTLSPAAIANSINTTARQFKVTLSPAQTASAYQAVKSGTPVADAVRAEVAKQIGAALPGTMTPEQVAAEIAARQGNRSPARP